MKKVFNYTGVRDWTLYDQDFMQESYTEIGAAIINAHQETSGALILYGMIPSNDLSNLSPGALYYNGEVFQFPGSGMPDDNPYLNRLDTPSIYDSRQYLNSTTHDTWIDRVIELGASAGTNTFGRLNSVARMNETISLQDTSLSFPNAIFESVTKQGGVTFNGHSITLIKKGNRITLSGHMEISLTSVGSDITTPNNISFRLDMLPKFEGVELSGPYMGVATGLIDHVSSEKIAFSKCYVRPDGQALEIIINLSGSDPTIVLSDTFIVDFTVEYRSV